jgi:hypothetical protein
MIPRMIRHQPAHLVPLYLGYRRNSNVIKRLQRFVTVEIDVFLRELPEGDPFANNDSSLCLCSPFFQFLF